MTTFYDGAWPPGLDPGGAVGALIYTGGDTPNPITTQAALNAYVVGAVRYILPGWVRSNAGGNAAVDAAAFISWLKAFGAPVGITTFLDLETLIDPAYVNVFGAAMHSAGYKVLVYGSESTLFQNPILDGYFVSNPTGADHIVAGTVATQWDFATSYDLDDVASGVTLWNLQGPSLSSFSTSQEPAMYSHTTAPNGVTKDAIWINPDGSVEHGHSPSGSLTAMAAESLGGNAIQIGSHGFDGSGNYTVVVIGTDNTPYFRVGQPNATSITGYTWLDPWTQLKVALHPPVAGAPGVPGKPGNPGPPGPSYNDAPIKAQIATVLNKITQVAKDLAA